jgi:predicted glycogen debranching enzyme
MPAWRYITACVRQEYPETIFLLEGLGGSWEATDALLTDGGMQWAYSELFQNYTGVQVASYLDYANRQSARTGLYVHYSETHDNDRLAKGGRIWSLLRNRLCALTSASGSYGFTCGVEWLATEKINVHSSRGMSWGSSDNINAELARLNKLLRDHPCFFDSAKLTRLSPLESPVFALHRASEEGVDQVLILVNTDRKNLHNFALESAVYSRLDRPDVDLLGQMAPPATAADEGVVVFQLPPGACYCLARSAAPAGLAGDTYRRARGCAAFAVQALSQVLPVEEIGTFSWRALAERVERDPMLFLAALRHLNQSRLERDLVTALDSALAAPRFPQVIVWERLDARRVTLVPPDHWLLVQDDACFRASLSTADSQQPSHLLSIEVRPRHVVAFPPRSEAVEATLLLERYAADEQHITASIRFLGQAPDMRGLRLVHESQHRGQPDDRMILLTNGRGGMARLNTDLGRIQSKYDCLLGANLHPTVPVDRHVFAKRVRAWVIADHFITPLDHYNLVLCEPGPPARWLFVANAGDGRTVAVQLEADLLEGRNVTVLRFTRPTSAPPFGSELPEECDVRLTVRIDIEDRNFHWETRRNGGADYHFSSHCWPLPGRTGFEFTPAPDRVLRVFADAGEYHHEAEWSENIPHPIEESRGQTGSGDAYSPGWFDLPLPKGAEVTVVAGADPEEPSLEEIRQFSGARQACNESRIELARLPADDLFGRRLVLAAHQFVVRRGEGKTVIAGYPWFLDWGRDTFICARGLLAAGLSDTVRQILTTFGRFEHEGTLPNSIFGEDANNRDTSDAPLWFGIVCEEAAALDSRALSDRTVDARGRTLRDVLKSIADGYQRGTPNGIRVDPDSGLVWSPSHFTWMDTNYPAGTPREGYPVEIQVLWIRLLRHLERIDPENAPRWHELADRAEASLLRFFWIEEKGYLADCLLAGPGQRAASAVQDTALRSNYLFAVSLGLLTGERARHCVQATLRHLVVPGALRSLAPLPVSTPLPVKAADGRLLNDPQRPYWGQYVGDEDTRRKPAYHNGTAWTWTFPTFCEALARAWDLQPTAVAAARSYLASCDHLLTHGCLGQLPEIVDGDAPHTPRGCDAQAWGVTEALRVWKWLRTL